MKYREASVLLSRSRFPSWDATNRASNASVKSRCRRKFCNDRGNRRRLGLLRQITQRSPEQLVLPALSHISYKRGRIRRVVTEMLRGQPCSLIRRTNRHGWFIRETANLPRLITRETFRRRHLLPLSNGGTCLVILVHANLVADHLSAVF